MTLTEYLNQTDPAFRPYSFVKLAPEDYRVISEYKSHKEVFIPALVEKFPECTGIYYKESDSYTLKTESGKNSCFYIL